jgi:hypothetical protein
MQLKLETDLFSDEEIDRINEATYNLNSVARRLIFIRLGIPVKDGNLREKVRKVRNLLEGI